MLQVVIVGGGLAGFSAAIGLALSGHGVTLLESQKEFRELGAGIQLMPNATRIMRSWSLLDQVRAKATQPTYLCFRSYRDGEVLHNYRVTPGMEQAYSSPYLTIHRHDLLTTLIEKARDLGVRLELDSAVSHLDTTVPCVTTTRGQTFTADLIVGADGEHSSIRSILLDRPYVPQPTGKLVYRLSIDLEKVRADSDLRMLLEPSTVTLWLGPSTHVVAYDMLHRGALNVVLACTDPIKGRTQFGPRKVDITELRSTFLGWDPVLIRLLEMATEASYWTMLQLPQENRQWMDTDSHRVILIGDAAHAMMPHLTQGAAQGIEDGAFLGHLFGKDATAEAVPASLRFFCERRQPRALLVRSRSQEAGEIYALEDGEQQKHRDRQMREGKLCDGFPNPIADPVLSNWLYNYDVEADARPGNHE